MARYARADEARALRHDQARKKAKCEKKIMRITLKTIRRLSAVAGLVILAAFSVGHIPASGQTAGDELERGFRNPPAAARPRVWWHWMNGNITKDGI
jgi:hypothetical protein